jgi:two-component system, cell cycle response regulator CpdR
MNILVAEDDPDTLKLYSLVLRDRGHYVVLTEDGEKCLVVYNNEFKKVSDTTDFRDRIQPFDALILDHKMPKIDGFEVAKEILVINPHQRIIIASAYKKEIFDEAADSFGLPLEVLQKPFRRDTLIATVEDTALYDKLKKHLEDIEPFKKANLRHEQLKAIADAFDKEESESASPSI